MAHPSTPQPKRANPLTAPHQLRIAFDCVDLRGMTPTDRNRTAASKRQELALTSHPLPVACVRCPAAGLTHSVFIRATRNVPRAGMTAPGSRWIYSAGIGDRS